MGTDYENPTPIRTVIAMDFDNDGNQELFMNNIDYQSRGAPNSVHSVINSLNVSKKQMIAEFFKNFSQKSSQHGFFESSSHLGVSTL